MNAPPRRREVGEPPAEPAANEPAPLVPIDQQHAIVVGIDSYAGDFLALANARADAVAVAELLQHDYGFALQPAAAPLLDAQAGAAAIRSVVQASLEQAGATTRWLFYFAGHGVVVAGQGYLLPHDAVRDEPRSYLALQWLLDAVRQSRCAEALLIIDACYAGRALVAPSELSDLIRAGADGERVCQLISSGNPDQAVLDSGGSGHSVFTQALLDALAGWAGIHAADGAIYFLPLLDHLMYEVPVRLRASNQGAARQQPIGGNLLGTRNTRGVILRPLAPRLDPQLVRGSQGDDPLRRRESMARLESVAPAARPLALELALRHLRSGQVAASGPLVLRMLHYEPAAEVRAQAAATLGLLGDRAAVDALIEALDDTAAVCGAAAAALARLGEQRAARPLLERAERADNALFLELAGAIGALDDTATTVALLQTAHQRGLLVPWVGMDLPDTLTGLPSRSMLAGELARREQLPASAALAEVAAATMGVARSRYSFTHFLRDKLADQLRQPGALHQAIAQLHASLVISGAYDGLLARAIGANPIVSGEGTRYIQAAQPTLLQLAGSLDQPESLLVIEEDYAQLRKHEADRTLLLAYLRNALSGKLVLLLGYDPHSPDFALLRRYLLNQHLAGVPLRLFLVWETRYEPLAQDGALIQAIRQAPLALMRQLGKKGE